MLSRFNYILYKILGVYIIFGSLFVKSIYAIPLSRIELVVFFVLTIMCFFRGQNSFPTNENKFIIGIFYLYLLFAGLSLIGTPLRGKNTGLVAYMQYLFLPLYIYIFLNFSSLTKKKITDYLRYIVYLAVMWTFVNTFLYFFELPIWEEHQQWIGRISNGYPTVDVVCLNYTLFILLFLDNLGIGKIRRLFSTFIIIIGIISQFSGTGTAILFVMIFSFILSSLKKEKQKLKWNFYISLVSVFLFLLTGFAYFYAQQPELTKYAMSVITKKISFFVGEDNVESEWNSFDQDTMEVREEEFEIQKRKHLTSLSNRVFGVGFKNVTTYSSFNSKDIFIEDQYGMNLVTIGYIGSFLFVLFVISPLKRWIKFYKPDKYAIVIGCLPVFFYLLSSKTTLTMVTMQIELIFALFYSILLYPSKFAQSF